MDDLETQCECAKDYPLNVLHSSALAHRHQSKFTRLNEQQGRLFCSEAKACLNFLEYGAQSLGDWFPHQKKTTKDLWTHLFNSRATKISDPKCRYVFVQAPNARERLNTTREMFALLLTYLQVMPDFVEYLFPFGKQSMAQDFHFSAFRYCTQLRKVIQGLEIRELGWSGRIIQICYNLKSVEQSPSQVDRPWSIRHCAINHSFDVETGRTSWIIMKANKLIQERLTQATSHGGLREFQDFSTSDRAFTAVLATHRIICDWSTENWRWYINWLEEKQQVISRRTIANEIIFGVPSKEKTFTDTHKLNRVQTDRSERPFSPKLLQKRTPTMEELTTLKEEGEKKTKNMLIHRDSGLEQPVPFGVILEGGTLPEGATIQYDEYGQQDFSFRDLQDLHFIDGQADEAALVIKHDISVLKQVNHYYQRTSRLTDFPKDIETDCAEELSEFDAHLHDLEMELEMQVTRLETLQRSTADCKVLLHSIMDFRTSQSNKLLAIESRESTRKMESMTSEMKDVARKTQSETVLMKMFSGVTLLFLPGTFISTLMSTDIFQDKETPYPGPNPYTVLSPLQFFFAASIPLTLTIPTIWLTFHWWKVRKENFEKLRSFAETHGLPWT